MRGDSWIHSVKLLTTDKQAKAALSHLPFHLELVEDCAKDEDGQIRALPLIALGRSDDITRVKTIALHDSSERVQALALKNLARYADDATLTSVALATSRLRRRQLLTDLRRLRRQSVIDDIIRSLRAAGDLASFRQHLYFASDPLIAALTSDDLTPISCKIFRKLALLRPMAMSRLFRKYADECSKLNNLDAEIRGRLCRMGRAGREEGLRFILYLFESKRHISVQALWDLRKELPRIVDFVTSDEFQERCREERRLRNTMEGLFDSSWLYPRLDEAMFQRLMACAVTPLTWRAVLEHCPNKCKDWRQQAADQEFKIAILEQPDISMSCYDACRRIAAFPKCMRERLASDLLRRCEKPDISWDALCLSSWDSAFPEFTKAARGQYWPHYSAMRAMAKLILYNRERLSEVLSLFSQLCFPDGEGTCRWRNLESTLELILAELPPSRFEPPENQALLRRFVASTVLCFREVTTDSENWLSVTNSYKWLVRFLRRLLPYDVEYVLTTFREIAEISISACFSGDRERSEIWERHGNWWPFREDLPVKVWTSSLSQDKLPALLDYLKWRIDAMRRIYERTTDKSSLENEINRQTVLGTESLLHKSPAMIPYFEELLRQQSVHCFLHDKISILSWRHFRKLFLKHLKDLLLESPVFIHGATTRIALAEVDAYQLLAHLKSLQDFEWGREPTVDRRMLLRRWPSACQSELAQLCVVQINRIQNAVPKNALRVFRYIPAADPSHLLQLADDTEALDNKREIALRLLGHMDGPRPLERLTKDLKDATAARTAIYALVPKLKYMPIADVATILDSTNCSHLQVAKQVLRMRTDLHIPGWEILLIRKLKSKKAHDDIQRTVVRSLTEYLSLPHVWDALEEAAPHLQWRVLLEILELPVAQEGSMVKQRHTALVSAFLLHEEPLLRSKMYEKMQTRVHWMCDEETLSYWRSACEAFRRADDEGEIDGLKQFMKPIKPPCKQEDVVTLLEECLSCHASTPIKLSLRRMQMLISCLRIEPAVYDLVRRLYAIPQLRQPLWRCIANGDKWTEHRDFCDEHLAPGLTEFYIMDVMRQWSNDEICASFRMQDELCIFQHDRAKIASEGRLRGYFELNALRYSADKDSDFLPESRIPLPFPVDDEPSEPVADEPGSNPDDGGPGSDPESGDSSSDPSQSSAWS